jgi:phosphohistidine phosphatase
MAELAARLNIEVADIRHSGKLRADQTAEALEQVLGVKRRQVPGLGPNDDINPVAREVSSLEESIVIVGHLPFLGRLAAFLLCQDESLPVVAFKNAGIVRLDRNEDGRWSLVWNIPPEAVL